MAERIIKRIDKATLALPTLSQTDSPYKRVAAYARVSTASEEQLNSVEAQKDYFEKMILQHEGWILVGVYADEGISGTSIHQRKAFLQMIEDAMAGKIDLIITKSISRFARNTVDSLNVIRQLKARNVEVFFEKENIYTLDTKGEFLITLMSSLAEEEARSLSENVKWGKRKAFADGKYSLPYKSFLGYKKGPDNLPEIVQAEAQVIRWIYYLYLTGTAPTTIAKLLMEAHIPTPANKTKWEETTIISILRNEKYYGAALLQKTFRPDYRVKKSQINQGELPRYYIENDHEPIIPKEIFDEVQRGLATRKRAGESHTLFANQIYCTKCGSAYGPRIWHSTTFRDIVWECIYSFRHGRCCRSPHLYECLIIPVFRSVVRVLLDKHLDVWMDCMDTLAHYMDITLLTENGIEKLEQTGEPGPTERTAWHLLFPRVMVYPQHKLVFHVVDGSQIRYQMRKTTPRAKRLTPYEREEVLETYHNGAPIEVLAEQYSVKIDTIRYLIKNEAKQREAK